MNRVTDEELMQRFSKGEYEAFEVLYQRHKGGLYRYFLRQVNEQSKAEDLFQDIWSQVIASASRYSEKAKFTTWLYTMAKNKLVDHIRHVKVVTKVIDEQCDWQESDVELNVKQSQVNQTEKSFESSHQADAIKHCVGKLPQHQLDCFLLKEEAGMQISDIAEMMNSGLEATKSRLRYAYKNLRECLQHKLGEQNVTSIVDDVREQSA